MKPQVAKKRDIVRRFKSGESIGALIEELRSDYPHCESWHVQQVLRDYMNGKFALKLGKAKEQR